MNQTSTEQSFTCQRCRQALPKDVAFCAACGFDNGEFVRMGKLATFDQKIEQRIFWLKLKQFLPWFLR
jgi:ribosomal protein L37E